MSVLRSLLGKLSFASFVGAAISQATASIRNEVAAAKAEFMAKIKGIILGAILVLFATGIALFGIGLFAYAALTALAEVWPTWVAALTVGGGLLLIALILLGAGLRRIHKNSDLRPERLVRAYERFNIGDR